MTPQGQAKVFHVNLLKKWFPRTTEESSLLNKIDEHEGGITDRDNANADGLSRLLHYVQKKEGGKCDRFSYTI